MRSLRLIQSLFVALAAFFVTTAGCDQKPTTPGTTAATIQLNWKAEPQFGGFYAAAGTFDSPAGTIDLSVAQGGPGIATIDMIAAGTVPFGIVSGDELVIARARGKDVVALLAIYQTNPQGIMAPAARGLKKIDDVFAAPGTLAMERGLPYSQYLENKFGFGKLKIVPSPFGDLTQFRTQPDYAMQCFVTSEPLSARKAGLEATSFLIADAGWNPYTTVLATKGAYLTGNRSTVEAVVARVRSGWEQYLADPSPTNLKMQAINPTMDIATFAQSAEIQKPLIVPEATTPVGSMTEQRWQVTIDQLAELKVIESRPKATDCFLR